MSLDSIEYLEEDRVNGCNLYAYCGNDPTAIIFEAISFMIRTANILNSVGLLLIQ